MEMSMNENAQAGAYFLGILSILLILVGFILLIAGPTGFLTYADMGLLLIVIGFVAVLLTGLIPSRRSRTTRVGKCVNCGVKISSGYLCEECEEKLGKV